MQKQTLQQIFAEIGNHSGKDLGGNDKGSIHTYLETYDRLFAPFRDGCTILEIGLATGDSIKLWDRYFENSKIIGVDISLVFTLEPTAGIENKNKVYVIEADATKPEFLEHIKNQTFSIINDDASHVTSEQVATFHLLKHKMKPGGIYLIEDLLALDIERETYLSLHENVEIFDFRHVNGRFDNAFVLIRF